MALHDMALSVRGLGFGYGRKPLLEGLGFELEPGEVLGLVGPNGAGKSTIIKLLTRLLKPVTGEIRVGGRLLERFSRFELARVLAVVPQGGELPAAFRAHDLIMMGRTPRLGFLAAESAHDREVVEAVMRRTDTWRFAARLLGELSGGERQRVLLARALAQEPRLLLLDEPTNHLDLRYQAEVLRLTRLEVRRGLGALIVLHDLNLAARACDRLLVLHGGRIVAAGEPGRVLSQDLIRRVYGAEADVFLQPHSAEPVVMPRL